MSRAFVPVLATTSLLPLLAVFGLGWCVPAVLGPGAALLVYALVLPGVAAVVVALAVRRERRRGVRPRRIVVPHVLLACAVFATIELVGLLFMAALWGADV